jgi:hypothetical protein
MAASMSTNCYEKFLSVNLVEEGALKSEKIPSDEDSLRAMSAAKNCWNAEIALCG